MNQRTKRLPFALLSLLVACGLFAIGIAVTVASGYFENDRLFNSKQATIAKFGYGFFVAMILSGLASIVLSILGCGLYRIQNKTLPICYAGFLTPVWVIMIALAAIIGNLTRNSDLGFTQFCNPSQTQYSALNNLFGPAVIEIDNIIVPMASKWMCSQQCACNETYKAQWTNLPASELINFSRTKDQLDKNDSDGSVRLNFLGSTAPDAIFYNFADCFYSWKTDWEDPNGNSKGQFRVTPSKWIPDAQADFESINSIFGTLDLVAYLAESENCNGICNKALFGFS